MAWTVKPPIKKWTSVEKHVIADIAGLSSHQNGKNMGMLDPTTLLSLASPGPSTAQQKPLLPLGRSQVRQDLLQEFQMTRGDRELRPKRDTALAKMKSIAGMVKDDGLICDMVCESAVHVV